MAGSARLAQKIRNDLRTQDVLIVGFDGGNSTSVLSIDGTHTQITSYIGTGDLSAYACFSGELTGGGWRPGDHVLDDGTVWFIGDVARMQCADATTEKGNIARYSMGHTRRLFQAMMAAHVVDRNPDVREHPIRTKLVTGIPIALYRRDPTLATTIAESYVGDYWYRYTSEKGTYTIHMVIEACHVMMEGLSPLIAFGVKGKPQGFIDIGGGSIDVGVVDENKKPLYERSQSLQDWGVERIVDTVSAQFRSLYGRPLSPREQALVIPSLLGERDMIVYDEGERVIPLSSLTGSVRQATEMVDSFLKNVWGARPGHDLAQVAILGGGAHVIHPTLHAGERVILPEPHAKNAESYAAIARHLDQKNAWKTVLEAF